MERSQKYITLKQAIKHWPFMLLGYAAIANTLARSFNLVEDRNDQASILLFLGILAILTGNAVKTLNDRTEHAASLKDK